MDDVDRVLVFRDVVESGGFSQAAARRGVVHSTISRQVKELEESLGVLLMTRTTRTRSLTAAGELFEPLQLMHHLGVAVADLARVAKHQLPSCGQAPGAGRARHQQHAQTLLQL
ncbi:MAG: LysR family transcriptional regulator, partial [Myxococcota bacterium]